MGGREWEVETHQSDVLETSAGLCLYQGAAEREIQSEP